MHFNDDQLTVVYFDFLNKTWAIRYRGQAAAWTSYQEFIDDSTWPFTDVVLLTYEPIKEIYHVERYIEGAPNDHFTGIDLPEIVWVIENIDRLQAKLQERTVVFNTPTLNMEQKRLEKLWITDWACLRHQDELALGRTPTLNDAQYIELLEYRQALRDLGTSISRYIEWTAVPWPVAPEFIRIGLG
jgi:hypothetical protein